MSSLIYYHPSFYLKIDIRSLYGQLQQGFFSAVHSLLWYVNEFLFSSVVCVV